MLELKGRLREKPPQADDEHVERLVADLSAGFERIEEMWGKMTAALLL